MDYATKQRLHQLEERVNRLEAELAARKRGQTLATDDADHYELGWSKQVDELKGLLREASAFIKQYSSAKADDVQDLTFRIADAVGKKVESDAFVDFDAQLTMDILGLVIEEEIDYAEVAKWTWKQRQDAERWAAQQHAIASDNEVGEPLYAKPEHVQALQDKSPKRSDLYDVELRPQPPREDPGLTWAKRMKNSPLEWERLHRIEVAARNTRASFREPDRDHVASAMCRVLDAVALERIKEWEGRGPAALLAHVDQCFKDGREDEVAKYALEYLTQRKAELAGFGPRTTPWAMVASIELALRRLEATQGKRELFEELDAMYKEVRALER